MVERPSLHAMTWEQRWHPLRQEWVVVAAHRQERPWSGERVAGATAEVPAFDPTCYFCPGNARVSGQRNAEYSDVFVFDNDLPCVGTDAPAPAGSGEGVLRARRAEGVARV